MNYITVSEASKKWNVPVRTICYRCETGKLLGAKFEKGVWLIPDSDFRPIAKGGRSLLIALRAEKEKGILNGIYGKIVVDFTYHSLKIADYNIPYEYIKNLFEGKIVSDDEDLLYVESVVAVNNCFKCIDYIIDNASKMLSEKFIRNMYAIISAGLPDFDMSLYSTVNEDVKNLCDAYNENDTKSVAGIIVFSFAFNDMEPFNRANYMLSKLIVLKECMKYRFTPYIIHEDRKEAYIEACKNFYIDKKPLLEEVKHAQNYFRANLKYFDIKA